MTTTSSTSSSSASAALPVDVAQCPPLATRTQAPQPSSAKNSRRVTLIGVRSDDGASTTCAASKSHFQPDEIEASCPKMEDQVGSGGGGEVGSGVKGEAASGVGLTGVHRSESSTAPSDPGTEPAGEITTPTNRANGSWGNHTSTQSVGNNASSSTTSYASLVRKDIECSSKNKRRIRFTSASSLNHAHVTPTPGQQKRQKHQQQQHQHQSHPAPAFPKQSTVTQGHHRDPAVPFPSQRVPQLCPSRAGGISPSLSPATRPPLSPYSMYKGAHYRDFSPNSPCGFPSSVSPDNKRFIGGPGVPACYAMPPPDHPSLTPHQAPPHPLLSPHQYPPESLLQQQAPPPLLQQQAPPPLLQQQAPPPLLQKQPPTVVISPETIEKNSKMLEILRIFYSECIRGSIFFVVLFFYIFYSFYSFIFFIVLYVL